MRSRLKTDQVVVLDTMPNWNRRAVTQPRPYGGRSAGPTLDRGSQKVYQRPTAFPDAQFRIFGYEHTFFGFLGVCSSCGKIAQQG